MGWVNRPVQMSAANWIDKNCRFKRLAQSLFGNLRSGAV